METDNLARGVRMRIHFLYPMILIAMVSCGCNLIKIGPQTPIATTQLMQPPRGQAIERDDFWAALGDLHFHYSGADGEQERFARAAAQLFAGHFATAEAEAQELRQTTADPLLGSRARELLLNALLAQGKWSSFLAIAPDAAAMAAGDTTYLADPNQRALVSGWAQAPDEEWHWGRDEMTLPMRTNRAGHAMVAVEINGLSKWFIIDTCADMTVVTASLAKEAGIAAREEHACLIGTSTSRQVSAAPATIAELRIGDLTLRNHRVLHMNDEDLEFRLLFFTFLKIEGILGWNAIRAMHLELDFAREQVLIARPHAASGDRAVGWAGESLPLVRLLTDNGTILWLRLDTGSTDTFLYHDVYRKLALTPERTRTERVGGAGGFQKVTTDVLADFALTLHRNRFCFPSMSVRPANESSDPQEHPESWARPDGLMGLDVVQGGKLILDASAGIFQIHPPEDS